MLLVKIFSVTFVYSIIDRKFYLYAGMSLCRIIYNEL